LIETAAVRWPGQSSLEIGLEIELNQDQRSTKHESRKFSSITVPVFLRKHGEHREKIQRCLKRICWDMVLGVSVFHLPEESQSDKRRHGGAPRKHGEYESPTLPEQV